MVETVWDNVTGAIHDVEESKQIGFTQDYSKFVPVVAGGGVAAGAVMATTDGKIIDTRLVIPFGRIFEGVFRAELRKAFPKAEAEVAPLVPFRQPETADMPVAKIRIVEFQVWEEPLNHLNLKARTSCELKGRDGQPVAMIEAIRSSNQSIGSVMATSGSMIKEMNRISNEFAAQLSKELLEQLQRKLSP